jgi:curved DNA-binding protein CbpA
VSPGAEPEVIQGAYRALMRKYHPDANGGAYSDARAKRINEAYAALSDPGSRADYDAQLRAAEAPAHPGVPPYSETAQSTAPPRPADGFAWARPGPKAYGKKLRWTRGLTVLVTVGLAAAGLAAGRLSASTPSPATPPAEQDPAGGASARTEAGDPVGGEKAGHAVSATRTVAAVVSDEIVPRWRPDCSAGAGNAVVDVQVNLARNGSVLSARLAGSTGDPLQLANATESARQAVLRAAPFALPRASYNQWRVFIVRFDTKDVCG